MNLWSDVVVPLLGEAVDMAVNVYARPQPAQSPVVRPEVPRKPTVPQAAPQGVLVAGPSPPPKAGRHCTVCGHPGARLTCAGCQEPVCADRPECCNDPKARPLYCVACDTPEVGGFDAF